MTIDELKTQWAKDHSYENYFEFLDLTRKCDTDHVFIMDCVVTQIAKRYAKSQNEKFEKHIDILHKLLDRIQTREVNVNDSIDRLINNALDEISKL